MKNKKLLIFDYDGTLVDSSSIHERAFKEVLKPLNVECYYEEISGARTKEAIIYLLNKAKIDYSLALVDDLVKKKQTLAAQMMQQELNLFPNVNAFLQQAYAFHLLVVVSSSSRKSVESGLSRFALQDLFAHIICAENVTNCKPHPECFLLALTKMGIDASSALVFEDSTAGFLAAEAAGVDYIDVKTFDWIYQA